MSVFHSDVVRVTKEDIKNGEIENANCCAVALAVERTFTKHYDNLDQRVSKSGYISFRDRETNECEFHLEMSNTDTNKIRDFVHNFDEGNDVEPFEFNATLREGSL